MYRRFCRPMVPEINIPTLLFFSLSLVVIIIISHNPHIYTHSTCFPLFISVIVSFFTSLFLFSKEEEEEEEEERKKEESSDLFHFSFPFLNFFCPSSYRRRMMSGTNKFPFTASQWQELEHQALIFKYMVSGIPIPSDLLFTIKRSCLDSTLSSKLYPHQPSHIGWSWFQMGLGRKIDPEPGRCRRTDGKKWRCSKEAYPDSKYCERHMHRGKNRSRKPVEIATQTVTANPSITTTVSSINKNHSTSTTLLGNTPPSHSLSLLSSETHLPHQSQLHYPSCHSHLNHQFFSSQTSSRPPGISLSHQDNSTPLLLDSAGSLTNADYRNAYGLKEDTDEHAFFSSEPSSGSMRSLAGSSIDDAWQFTPLTMSSSSSTSSSSNQRSLSSLHNEYSYLQLHSLNDNDGSKQQKQYHQRSYLLGSEMKCPFPMKTEREEPQKTVHRFFDEWPPKNKGSWLDLDDKSPNSTSVSTTRLSISIPTSSHDFPIFNSRTHNDG